MWKQGDIPNDYIMVKALENGVSIIGLTRGHDTKFHHSEKLDAGEVIIAQFTEHTSAIKIRGRAVIYTNLGCVESGTTDESFGGESPCGQ
ncbi:MAG: trp RNA-binding attenuation protein MtrB [Firmicutes bacterium]|nr:trp RNA-binding attenuation protein MtrB [Bacillota bacterium]